MVGSLVEDEVARKFRQKKSLAVRGSDGTDGFYEAS